jgi:hypothetical protein
VRQEARAERCFGPFVPSLTVTDEGSFRPEAGVAMIAFLHWLIPLR